MTFSPMPGEGNEPPQQAQQPLPQAQPCKRCGVLTTIPGLTPDDETSDGDVTQKSRLCVACWRLVVMRDLVRRGKRNDWRVTIHDKNNTQHGGWREEFDAIVWSEMQRPSPFGWEM